jgi:hypothetical protein
VSANDLRARPYSGKIFDIPSHGVIRCGCLSALQEYIVVRVGTDMHLLGGLYPETLLTNGAQRGYNFTVTAIEPGATDDFFILGKKYYRSHTVAYRGR